MLTEYEKTMLARWEKGYYMYQAYKQHMGLTFKPSDFHNLPCKPMRMKR